MKQILLLLLLLQTLYARENVTEKIEHLGNPYIDKYRSGEFIYARNIWDMQVFDGDFYFGLGCEIKNSKDWKQSKLKPQTGEILRVKKGR